MARRALKQTPPDAAAAEQWLERGAAVGDGECAFQLSRRKTAADRDDEAVKWLQVGADRRNPNACFALSERYRLGQGVLQDPTQATRLLRCAAEIGHGEAMYRLGKSLPPVEAVSWYERAIRLRHAEAINAHAELLLRGEGIARNVALAEERFQTAADLGSNAAYVNYARLLEQRDPRAAQRWYRAAAERGYPPAQRIYGEILLTEGFGIYRSDGIAWLGKAADQGDADAAYQLGQMYTMGQHVDRDEEQARKYFATAHDLGHPDAAARLAAPAP